MDDKIVFQKYIKTIFYIFVTFISLTMIYEVLFAKENVDHIQYFDKIIVFLILFVCGSHVVLSIVSTLSTWNYISNKYESYIFFHPLTYINTFTFFISVLPF